MPPASPAPPAAAQHHDSRACHRRAIRNRSSEGRGRARPAPALARGAPARRRPLRVHVPLHAALPTPVAVGLVLPRDRVAALRPRSRAGGAAHAAARGARRRLRAPHRLLGLAGRLAPRALLRHRQRARGDGDGDDRPAGARDRVGARRRGRPGVRARGPRPAARPSRLARARARPRRRRAAHDHPSRRVRPRRLAQVRPGLPLDGPPPPGLLPPRPPLPAPGLRREGHRGAPRGARRGRAGQRPLRAVAAGVRAAVGGRGVRAARGAR